MASGRTLDAIEAARQNRANGVVYNEDDTIIELAAEVDLLRKLNDDWAATASDHLAEADAARALANIANECRASAERECERLTFALHCHRAHPDYEYTTTQTARKSGDDPRRGLKDVFGWEPNDVVPIYDYAQGVVEQRYRNWERHEFHEDNHWRRRKA